MMPNRSMMDATVIPELAYSDVNVAADWLAKSFGFVIRLRIGDHRVQMLIGDGAMVITSGSPAPDSAASHAVMVRVADVDAHFARAKAAGAAVLGAPTTHMFGERQYAVLDCAGHRWVFSQSVADVDPAEWGGERVA
jgi:uncharacterized glyoxalase superfamily protein PhnB